MIFDDQDGDILLVHAPVQGAGGSWLQGAGSERSSSTHRGPPWRWRVRTRLLANFFLSCPGVRCELSWSEVSGGTSKSLRAMPLTSWLPSMGQSLCWLG